jgi:hypothetical protein
MNIYKTATSRLDGAVLLRELTPGKLFYSPDDFFMYHSLQILKEDRYGEYWNRSRLTYTAELDFDSILVVDQSEVYKAIEVLIGSKAYWISLEDIYTYWFV